MAEPSRLIRTPTSLCLTDAQLRPLVMPTPGATPDRNQWILMPDRDGPLPRLVVDVEHAHGQAARCIMPIRMMSADAVVVLHASGMPVDSRCRVNVTTAYEPPHQVQATVMRCVQLDRDVHEIEMVFRTAVAREMVASFDAQPRLMGRALVVCGRVDDREHIKAALRRIGVTAVCVDHGSKAINMLGGIVPFDVVLVPAEGADVSLGAMVSLATGDHNVPVLAVAGSIEAVPPPQELIAWRVLGCIALPTDGGALRAALAVTLPLDESAMTTAVARRSKRDAPPSKVADGLYATNQALSQLDTQTALLKQLGAELSGVASSLRDTLNPSEADLSNRVDDVRREVDTLSDICRDVVDDA